MGPDRRGKGGASDAQPSWPLSCPHPRAQDWSRSVKDDKPLLPRENVLAMDLYIPGVASLLAPLCGARGLAMLA